MPDRFLREGAGLDLPAPGTTPSAWPSSRPSRAAAHGARGPGRAARRPRSPCGCWPGATYRSAPTWSARPPRTACRTSASWSSPLGTVGCRYRSGPAAFCLRKRTELELGPYFASLSARTLVYKGMLTTAQLEPFFPDLSDRTFESELALVHSPVLDQHLPLLAARAPVPADRAQRRDQHRQGQPQLDARPGEPAGERPDPGRPATAVPDLHAGRESTRRPSTRSSSCCTSAAAPCRTRC